MNKKRTEEQESSGFKRRDEERRKLVVDGEQASESMISSVEPNDFKMASC